MVIRADALAEGAAEAVLPAVQRRDARVPGVVARAAAAIGVPIVVATMIGDALVPGASRQMAVSHADLVVTRGVLSGRRVAAAHSGAPGETVAQASTQVESHALAVQVVVPGGATSSASPGEATMRDRAAAAGQLASAVQPVIADAVPTGERRGAVSRHVAGAIRTPDLAAATIASGPVLTGSAIQTRARGEVTDPQPARESVADSGATATVPGQARAASQRPAPGAMIVHVGSGIAVTAVGRIVGPGTAGHMSRRKSWNHGYFRPASSPPPMSLNCQSVMTSRNCRFNCGLNCVV